MKALKAIAIGLSMILMGALASTGYMGWRCGQLASWPMQTHHWYLSCVESSPHYQFHAIMIFLTFSLAGGLTGAFLRRDRNEAIEFGSSKWATLKDVIDAGLIMQKGQRSKSIRVLGKFEKHFVTYTGEAHLLICGGNRSGKGRGIGVPSALSIASSVVFHDSKGEYMFGDPKVGFIGTSGYRAKLGRVIYFNPKDRRSARYNPLMMVRKGDKEISDLQRLIITLMGRAPKDFWEKGGGRMMLAICLHILYGEPNREKNLAGVGRFLDRGDEGLEAIIEQNAHPDAVRFANSFFPGGIGSNDSDKTKGMRSGLNFTARDFLSFYDDPVAAEITSGLSQFEPADLARHDTPSSIYLVPPADDQLRAAPLMSLIIGQIMSELISQPMDRTASGHMKKHDTVLFLDEFPALGQMNDLIVKMPQMPGYGVTMQMFVQSIAQLDETYTPSIASTIVENCGASVWFASADPRTAQRISSMVGNATEVEQTVSTSRPSGALFGGVTTKGEREIYRPVMDTGAVRELASNKELIFVNGVKAIRAHKLQYDKEPIFKARLLPPPPIGDGQGNYPGLETIKSDWWDLRVSNPVPDPESENGETTRKREPERKNEESWPGFGPAGFGADDWMQQLEMTP